MTNMIEPEILQNEGSSLSIWRDAPYWKGRRTAAIGKIKFASLDEGCALLALATSRLKAEGYAAVIGPMDGDTWHAYRSVSESDGSPSFLMEPISGPHDVAALAQAGFEGIGNYVSTRVATRNAVGDKPAPLHGVEIVDWEGQSPEAFFAQVYALSVESFAGNAFYKPISQDDFLALYMPYVPFLKRELISFARSEGKLVGFMFGIPNYAEGPETKTAIVKTYASSRRGVGYLLLDGFHRNALDLGYDTTIHALIHADNLSLLRSRMHGGEVFRRYTLFGLTL
jgi:hypothetical protein